MDIRYMRWYYIDTTKRTRVRIERMKDMKIYTADRETGTFIEECATIEEAKNIISEYEASDIKDGIYEPDFYDVVNENHESIM